MHRASHFKLGIFILACVGTGAVALIWIGATRMFESSRTYAAFFAQPVTGLESGAPVKHLGIRIGDVDSVDLAPDDRVVRVLLKIKSGFHLDPAMALSLDQPGITGSPFLALEDTPPADRKEPPHPPTKYQVLPTTSGGGGIGGAMQGIEKKIASLDIRGLLDRWERVAAKLDSALDEGQVAQVLDDARAAVHDLRTTARSLKRATAAIDHQVEGIRPGTAAGIATRIERTTDLGENAVRNIDENVGSSVELLRQDLAQLKQAVVEARSLARSLRADPGRIIQQGGHDDPFRK